MPAAHAEAQLPTLDDAIAQALTHSPEVAMAQARVAYAEAQVRAAHHGWFHPDVRVSAGDNAITGSTRLGLQLGQDLMRLLTGNREAVQQAEHELMMARQQLTITQHRLIQRVCEVRAHLQQLEDVLTLNMRTVDEQAARLALANIQFDAATGTWEQVLSAQHALAQAEHELLQTQREQYLARVTFAQLVGAPLPAEEMQ
jgi:outer membrane protein TolC